MQREGKSLSEVTQDGWSCPDLHRVATGPHSERRLCSTGQEQGLPRWDAGASAMHTHSFPRCVSPPHLKLGKQRRKCVAPESRLPSPSKWNRPLWPGIQEDAP